MLRPANIGWSLYVTAEKNSFVSTIHFTRNDTLGDYLRDDQSNCKKLLIETHYLLMHYVGNYPEIALFYITYLHHRAIFAAVRDQIFQLIG